MLLCHVIEEYSCNLKSLVVTNESFEPYYISKQQALNHCRSVPSCSGLQSLPLSFLPNASKYCDGLRSPVLDLQKHNKLAEMKLDSYAFCHKAFQEFFAALWLASKYSSEKTKLFKCIKNVRDLISYEILIIFLCVIDPTAGKQFWLDLTEEVEFKGGQGQGLVCECMKEHTSDQIYFFIPHIYIGEEYVSDEDIMLLLNVMEEYSDNVKSMYVSHYTSENEDLIKINRPHLPALVCRV